MQFDLSFNTQNQASKELTAVARGARQAAPAPKGGIGRPGAPGAPGASAATRPAGSAKPWTLPQRGMAVFYGPGNTPRLSHYFLPRLLLEGKRVLLLDGANSADPRLLARLARERSVPFERFSRRVQIARAFTCFQLTELIARVPRFLASFPAEILMVTALPELYFDEDVRDWEARVAFEQALGHLRRPWRCVRWPSPSFPAPRPLLRLPRRPQELFCTSPAARPPRCGASAWAMTAGPADLRARAATRSGALQMR